MNQTTPSTLSTWTTRHIILATLVVFFIGLGVWVNWVALSRLPGPGGSLCLAYSPGRNYFGHHSYHPGWTLSSGLRVGVVGTLYTILVLIMLELAIEPRFFNRRQFSGFLLVLMMITFINALGLIGLLIAPPVAVALQILLHHLLQEQIVSSNDKSMLDLTDLEERLAHMRTTITENLEVNSPQVMNLMERLGYVIGEAGQYTRTDLSVDMPVIDGHDLKLSE